MNYLAHALLAEPYPHSLIGNIAGDLVKGPLVSHSLHPRVAEGVCRHRRVDVLTDSHAAYIALKAHFPSGQRRYAGLVMDVLFDHYLTMHWERFSNWPRRRFIDGVYAILRGNVDLLPERLAQVTPHWTDADWLCVYESMDGVAAVLERLSQRLSRPVDLVALLPCAEQHASDFEAGFLQVFADVQSAIDGRDV